MQDKFPSPSQPLVFSDKPERSYAKKPDKTHKWVEMPKYTHKHTHTNTKEWTERGSFILAYTWSSHLQRHNIIIYIYVYICIYLLFFHIFIICMYKHWSPFLFQDCCYSRNGLSLQRAHLNSNNYRYKYTTNKETVLVSVYGLLGRAYGHTQEECYGIHDEMKLDVCIWSSLG